MSGGKTLLDKIVINLKNRTTGNLFPLYIDIYDSSLNRKWLSALNDLLRKGNHLEKNYCFLGFADSDRGGNYLTDQMNQSIAAINKADIGYQINDHFTVENTINDIDVGRPGDLLNHDRMNWLHRYFEDLQGTFGPDGKVSEYYLAADAATRWHIRQLNLLCHEYENWVLSYGQKTNAPEWQRPNQLMCWLKAPRFELTEEDYEAFGIETLNKPLGSLTIGVNKAVGKHHWEVFVDEKSHSMDELTTTVLHSQTQAAGDFDIEWGKDIAEYDFRKQSLTEFHAWLIKNRFDPDDKSLTIGHPQCGQVDLIRTFGTTDYRRIWAVLYSHLDVFSIKTSDAYAEYPYHWSDPNYKELQIEELR